jgi:hypothetical protein
MAHRPDSGHEVTPASFAADVSRRTTLDEAVGILRSWYGWDDARARRRLQGEEGATVAARVVAMINATADHADPDLD